MGTLGNALTLTVDPSILASAPAFDAGTFNGTVGSDVAQYWSGQGVSIPATGANAGSTPAILIQGPLTGLNVVDSSGQALGQVQDFVVNIQTGELVYAVLTGGTSSMSSPLGSNFYVVPMTVLSWQMGGQSSASSVGNLGQVQANVAASAFQSAPSVSSIDQLDLTSPTWSSDIDNYWSTAR
jgi:hypothetical protein